MIFWFFDCDCFGKIMDAIVVVEVSLEVIAKVVCPVFEVLVAIGVVMSVEGGDCITGEVLL